MMCDEAERDYDAPYEGNVYSTDRDENRQNRITIVRRDIERAREFMAGPGGDMAREVALETVNMNDVTASAASFLTDVKRRIAAYNRTHEGRVRFNDHVAIVVRRMLAAEFPAYREYANLSRAECDEYLYRDDPEGYGWLNDFYGGALDHGGANPEHSDS